MKGEDGVDEMKEDLNANKIMYAFIRVEDPKTSLPKFVLLNWQGESAPGTRDNVQDCFQDSTRLDLMMIQGGREGLGHGIG